MIFDVIESLFISFSLGLLTPLTAVCVLPLLPGYLAFLAHKSSQKGDNYFKLALMISTGILTFMACIGIIFTTFFKFSLSKVIQTASPIAFGFLFVMGVLLLFDVDLGKFFQRFKLDLNTYSYKNSYQEAFWYGVFFTLIVLPCNPTFIAVLFTRQALSSLASFTTNILQFIFFGVGITFPILLIGFLGQQYGQKMTSILVQYKRVINIIVGLIFCVVSLYYIFFVF